MSAVVTALRGDRRSGETKIRSTCSSLTLAGVATYRTPALSTNDARWFFDHGFVVRQSLVMLQRTGRLGSTAIGRETPIGVEYDDVTCRHVMARQQQRLLSELLDIDGKSFAAPWNLSAPAFRHACRATSEHRVIIARAIALGGDASGSASGYVIVGRSAGQAYLQRLAVHPTHRRTGIAPYCYVSNGPHRPDHNVYQCGVVTHIYDTAGIDRGLHRCAAHFAARWQRRH